MKRFVGVDLHKNSFTVCYMDSNGDYNICAYDVSSRGIADFKRSLSKADEVAVEATGNSAHFARGIKECVGVVRIVNPTQFKVISKSVKMTDKNAAINIARFLSKGLIPEVRLRSEEESQIGSLISTRDKLVKLRSTLKNKIHSILNANGVVTRREMFGSKKGLDEILKVDIAEGYLFELRVIIEQIRSLNKSIKEITDELKKKGTTLKGHGNLTSITGIGDISATILLNAIGDIENFSDPKKLAAYIGIVPRVHVSNTTSHYGKITRMGNKAARTALVQSTFVAIRYNDYLRAFYLRLKAKKGTGKAIIATARKLLTIIYNTLKYNWVFEDFNKFVLAATD